MHKSKFGDAYDYTKRVLIHAIAKPDEWMVHPMLFYYMGGQLDIREYATFLGLPTSAVLPGHTRTRGQMVGDLAGYHDRYLFLDPDTGIACPGTTNGNRGDNHHITMQQLTDITRTRTENIVLVFDHAYTDGGPAQDKVRRKLEFIRDQKLVGAAIIVHEHRCACFILVSTKSAEIERVTQGLKAKLSIPEERLVTLP